jgi:trimeric autotransporter adhesin
MSISTIAGQSPAQLQSSQQSNWQNILGAASSALGMSTGALQQQLQQGQSLATIAQSNGVSTSSLVSSIAGALQQNGQVTGASAEKLQQIATNIVNRTPGTHRHHHHAGASVSGASGTAAVLAALSGSDASSSSSAIGATSALSYSATGSATTSASGQPGSSFSLLA